MNLTLLLTSQQKQEMDFLILLNKFSPNWVTKNDCLKQLSTSLSTLNKTQQSVETILLNSFSKPILEINTTLGYRINQNINTDFRQILLSSLQEAPLFNLLSSVYTTEPYNVRLLMEKLYLSRASFYREVTKLNHFLKTYRLSFDSKKGTLIGQQTDIRHFTFQLFWNVYKGINLPLTSNSPQAIDTLLGHMEEALGSPLNPISKRKMHLSLTVSFRDISKGHHVHEDQLSFAPTNKLFQLIYRSLQEHFYLIDPTFLQKESLFIYHSVLTQVLSINSASFKQWVIEYFQQDHDVLFTYASQLVSMIDSRHPGLFTTDGEKGTILTDLLIINLQIKNRLTEQSHSQAVSLREFSSQYCSFYSGLLEDFTQVEAQFQRTPGSTERFKALVATLEASLDLSDFERGFNIQIIAERESYSRKIQRELRRNSQHKLTFSNVYDSSATPDLVITDTTLDTLPSASYHISFPPRATDWKEIDQLLVSI